MYKLGILAMGLMWLWGVMELNVYMVDHADDVLPPKMTKETCLTDAQCEAAWGTPYADSQF